MPRPTLAKLTVHDLHSQREARAAVNHETYKMLLGQVYDRVRARAANRVTHMSYQVPPLVPGRPLFATSHAARYIADKLRLGGFEVEVSSLHPDVHIVHARWDARKPRGKPPRKPRRQSVTAQATAQAVQATQATASLPAAMAEASHRLNRLKAQLNL